MDMTSCYRSDSVDSFLFLFYKKLVNVDKNIIDIFQHHNMMM